MTDRRWMVWRWNVAAMIGLACAAALLHAQSMAVLGKVVPTPMSMQTITPTISTAILTNPGIGYQTSYTSAASDMQLPSSTEYVRYDWSQIESVQGTFDFSAIDTDLASAQAAGQRLAFRIMGFEDGNTGPQALKTAGFAGYNFTFNSTMGVFFPDLSQTNASNDLTALVTAMASHFATSAIDSVDLGFMGAYGEFDFSGTSPAPPYPSTTVLNTLTDAFTGHFTVPLAIGGELQRHDNTAFQHALAHTGYRLDCWGDYAVPDGEMTTTYPGILSAAGTAWQTGPFLLETCGTFADWITLGYPWQTAIQWAIDNHASAFNNKSATIPAVMMSTLQDMLTKIGYRFVLTQAQLPTTVTVGGTFPLTLAWSNVGNAPIYQNRHILVQVGGHITDTGVSMTGLLPGTRTDTVTVSTLGVTAGTYTVQVGLAPPSSTTPDIHLAILGSGPWYPLASIRVQ